MNSYSSWLLESSQTDKVKERGTIFDVFEKAVILRDWLYLLLLLTNLDASLLNFLYYLSSTCCLSKVM